MGSLGSRFVQYFSFSFGAIETGISTIMVCGISGLGLLQRLPMEEFVRV